MNEISIYIHWPFCLSKCPYCDFNSHVSNAVNHGEWLECYKKEIEYFQEYINKKYVKSIFFGGGTPSLMDPSTVKGVIDKIKSIGVIDEATEITLEANPTSFEAEKFKLFKAAGVNRVSIGVQSLINDDLRALGRNHDKQNAVNAIVEASNIFPKYSFDLIYAREGQSLEDWKEELEEAMKYARGHISLYQLTIEKGTEFYKLHKDKILILPEQKEAAKMYDWTTAYLKKLGYNRYEVSNYATIGFESVHNLAYWNYDSYIGLGPGAHGRIHESNNIIAMNTHYNPLKWINSLKDCGNAVQSSKVLTLKEKIQEVFIMGLRLKEGITLEKLKKLTGLEIDNLINIEVANLYKKQRLLALNNERIKLTEKGIILHNYIIQRLLKE